MATLPDGAGFEQNRLGRRGGDERGDERALEETPAAMARGARRSDRRERVRARIAADIPWWYSPWGHLAATTGIGLAVLVIASIALGDLHVGAAELAVVPAVIVLSNLFEWIAHKHLLHERRFPLEVLYDKHTPMHHVIYVEDDMALRSSREFRLVLIPAAGVLGIVLTAAPFAAALGHLGSPAAGWLFLVTASLYMVSYELLHLCHHAPRDSFFGRFRPLARLRAHHARHHDPRLMQRKNFNVTLPLFDWLLGTLADRDRAGTPR